MNRVEGNVFTFHHVSIKTIKAGKMELEDVHLHSTMYLLKLCHNSHLSALVPHLHSTMYLLKPKPKTEIIKAERIYIPPCIY